jgi:hypothetical protein
LRVTGSRASAAREVTAAASTPASRSAKAGDLHLLRVALRRLARLQRVEELGHPLVSFPAHASQRLRRL